MDYFLTFHWWYIPVAFIVIFLVFGKRKGGVVLSRVTAYLEVLDQRFADCRYEAKYSTFKEGTPDHIEIELKDLTIPVGDEVEFLINGKTLAMAEVKQSKKAEFDYWSDEGVEFPKIREGDELVIKYQSVEILKGRFS